MSVNDIYDLQNISRLASYVQHLRNEKGGRHRTLLTFNGDFLGPSVLSQATALSREGPGLHPSTLNLEPET